MAARTIKHGDHEHIVKTVKANVNGLIIDDVTKPTGEVAQTVVFKTIEEAQKFMDDLKAGLRENAG